MNNTKTSLEEFQVTDEMKLVWTLEMEITKVLLDLCEKHGLKIWASYGTLLGVVRHKGFIPWDDDMDFLMMREDYDKLYQLAQLEATLPEPFELVIVDCAIIRVCNKNTTMLNPHYKINEKYNYGIWVDILCLDNAPDEMSDNLMNELTILRRRIRIVNNAKNYCFKSFSGIRFILSHLFCLLSSIFKNPQVSIEQVMSDLRNTSSCFSGNRVWNFSQHVKEYPIHDIKVYDASWFSETLMLPFENMFLPCPVGYEKCLVTEFGENWRTPIMGGTGHEGVIIDTNTPYKKFIKERLTAMSFFERLSWMY